MTDGPTLDQPTLADCWMLGVLCAHGETEDHWVSTDNPAVVEWCAGHSRPLTVDDLIGLVKQIDGAEVIVSKVADWTVLTDGTWLVVPIPEDTDQ